MIQLTADSHILLARHPVDFRKGLDGFQALCRHQLQQDPRQDTWFVFLNRDCTRIRILRYDGNGFWLMTKRLSSGRFMPVKGRDDIQTRVLKSHELMRLLRGWTVTEDSAVGVIV